MCADCTDHEPEEPTINCHHCDGVIDPSDIEYETHNGDPCCEPCFDVSYYICACCLNVIRRRWGVMTTPHGDPYCPDCFDTNYTYCSNCEYAVGRDVVRVIDDSFYCESCAAEETGVIHTYSENVLGHLTADDPDGYGMLYGVELEVEVPNGRTKRKELAEHVYDMFKDHAILKEDGSLDCGFEIVTKPSPMAKHKEFFAKLSADKVCRRYLRSYDTATCGMHVHISRNGLTPLQIGKMQVFLHEPNNHDFIRAIAQRDPEEWADIKKPKKITDKDDKSRYTALNLRPRHTVELRIFKGTLKATSIAKNLEFAEALVRWCSAATAGISEVTNCKKFCAWVESHSYEWPALVAYLRYIDHLPSRPASPVLTATFQDNFLTEATA